METRNSEAGTHARFAVESRFIGQFAWFSDISDAYVFLGGLGKSLHEDHWKIVELV